MSDWDAIGSPTAPAEDPLAWDGGASVLNDNPGQFTGNGGDDFHVIAPEHVSKYEGADGDETCRNCGQVGHFKRDCTEPSQSSGECYNCGGMGHNKADCPEPPKNSGACYNCGEVGHNKADCTNPAVEREFTGECRICGLTGHRGSECPTATCRKCGHEGHTSSKCTNAYNIYPAETKDLQQDPAWEALMDADANGDVDDFRNAFFAYAKACPELTFSQLENCFRELSFKTFIIAKEPVVSDVHTNVDLQGNIDRKFVVSFQHTQHPRRKIGSENWPKTPEENLERLDNAGFVLDRMVPKCRNCERMGHTKKTCPEEVTEIEKPTITCNNCNKEGHYLRDCLEPRAVKSSGCRNCGGEGHRAAECTEPRDMSNVQCNHCQEMGHFSRECPTKPAQQCRNCLEEGHRAADCVNERVVQCRNCLKPGHVSRDCEEEVHLENVKCRNCDGMGHFSKDCPEPKDWSKVTCRLCGQSGHGAGRCPNPTPEETAAEGSFAEAEYAPVAAAGEWDTGVSTEPAVVAAEGDWGVPTAASAEGVTAW